VRDYDKAAGIVNLFVMNLEKAGLGMVFQKF